MLTHLTLSGHLVCYQPYCVRLGDYRVINAVCEFLCVSDTALFYVAR